MKWEKLGLIFCPDNNYDWMVSHAANPVVEHIDSSLFRIYFSPRDKNNCSSIGYVVIDINHPQKILQISEKPLLQAGALGGFDDSGTSMGCLINSGDQKYLYYLGWNLGVTVPWRNSIGLAINHSSELIFEKFSKAPIIDRHEIDPLSISYPWIIREGELWRMWYGSNLKWGTQPQMEYVIKYAESADGIHWIREGKVAVNFRFPDEYAIARPCVLKEEKKYCMWYSYRGTAYRIGYAESLDGISWDRLDEDAGITVSEEGWDSESIEYPCLFDHEGDRYMAYNGNGYGRSGFGLAVLVDK